MTEVELVSAVVGGVGSFALGAGAAGVKMVAAVVRVAVACERMAGQVDGLVVYARQGAEGVEGCLRELEVAAVERSGAHRG